jgi:hypothetical protein
MWLARQRDPAVNMESVPDVYGAVWGQGNGGALVRSIPLNVQELLLPSVHSYTIKAGVQQYRAWEIAGLIQQGDREARIAAADLSFSPKWSDQVVIGGKTYQGVSVNTCSPFSEAAIHIVQVRGGNG